MCSRFSTRNRIPPSHARSSAPSVTGESRSPRWTWRTWSEAASLVGGWIAAPTAGEATGLLLDRGCGDPPGHRCGIAHCPPGAGRDGLGSCWGRTCPPVPSRTRGCRVVLAAGAARGSGLRPGLQSPAWPPTCSVSSCVPGAPLIA